MQTPTTPPLAETPRPAASMVLLRQAPTGLEVLLLRRTAQAANMPGLYVFPGGKLDDADQTLAQSLLDQPPETLHASLNEPNLDTATAAGLYVAAVREALEECGLLLAEAAGDLARLDAPQARALLRAGRSFAEVLTMLQLRLPTQRLAPWSRWITPRAPTINTTRRFDTRFFVAEAPQGQTAAHDDEETTDSVWIAPRTALEQYRDRLMDLAPPQIMGLAHLARHDNVQNVLQEARSKRPPLIEPEHYQRDGTRVLCYPGDEKHSVSERALPGPTRLLHVEGRFTPEEGFEALFA